MVKIWAKIYKGDKIVKQTVLEYDKQMDYAEFFDYVTEICYALDAPTPVVIKTHIFNYAKYNYVKFIKNDFVEAIDFDKLVLENIATK